MLSLILALTIVNLIVGLVSVYQRQVQIKLNNLQVELKRKELNGGL